MGNKQVSMLEEVGAHPKEVGQGHREAEGDIPVHTYTYTHKYINT